MDQEFYKTVSEVPNEQSLVEERSDSIQDQVELESEIKEESETSKLTQATVSDQIKTDKDFLEEEDFNKDFNRMLNEQITKLKFETDSKTKTEEPKKKDNSREEKSESKSAKEKQNKIINKICLKLLVLLQKQTNLQSLLLCTKALSNSADLTSFDSVILGYVISRIREQDPVSKEFMDANPSPEFENLLKLEMKRFISDHQVMLDTILVEKMQYLQYSRGKDLLYLFI